MAHQIFLSAVVGCLGQKLNVQAGIYAKGINIHFGISED